MMDTTATDVEFDEQTALLVIDVQNDFAHPGGSLYVSGGHEIVERINAMISAARAAGALVVYTQDWHPPSTPHFVTEGGVWPVHCVRDTWGAEFHEDLDVDGPIIRKGTGGEDGYSGFAVREIESDTEKRTELEPLLRKHDIRRVVVVGLAQDVCVKATAIDAARLGFDTVVDLDAVRPVEVRPGDADAANAEMSGAGVQLR